MRHPCGSGRAREAGNTGNGTGFAGVRGHARSHKGHVALVNCVTAGRCSGTWAFPSGSGLPTGAPGSRQTV
ncbi:hypothetical protein B7H19_24095 [Pseudomonas putida]|nr:hypothetical protein B7H19_24095 [Pseudomonas putida]